METEVERVVPVLFRRLEQALAARPNLRREGYQGVLRNATEAIKIQVRSEKEPIRVLRPVSLSTLPCLLFGSRTPLARYPGSCLPLPLVLCLRCLHRVARL